MDSAKWEYDIITASQMSNKGDIIHKLNKEGWHGWEVYAVCETTLHVVFYMKRRIA